MDLRLDGKVAIVTGASRGIGRAIATAYAESGATVVLNSRTQEALDEAAADIDGETSTYAGHAGDPDTIAACVADTVERFGQVDILVNNAATNPYAGPTIDVDLPRYDKTLSLNLRAPLVWAQECWHRSMQGRPGCSVINVSSIGGMQVDPVLGVYDTTKAALIHLTKILAIDLAPTCRVNGIAPGLVKTDFARMLWEPAEEKIAKTMPLGRLGTPEDIADTALFLASDLASWMTGHTMVVDGGALIRPHR